ncbi:MAG: UDP-N-acetylmuramate dehydrogenase [Desulfuromonadaceae bacterium]|nr:UDP-N-acetylmuramate dehydrogenase [Desulfuromonadaceae bacterium]MDD2855832.1 UDP-N-acetylmuramate dehydrogenase [Desulfuromonadaceae bacterium]
MKTRPPGLSGLLLYDEPMSRHTSLKVGGPADLFAIPKDIEDLQVLISWLQANDIPWLTIGRGYNLLVRDRGIRGAVISLECFNRITNADNNQIIAESGVENLALVRYAQQLGLGGISFISGIPGTIGGAIRMNAGAYGRGILDCTESITLLRGASIDTFCLAEMKYGYRYLQLESGDIVISAVFNLHPCDYLETEDEIRKDLELRRSKHNVGFPSAGSFFKNPEGEAAWKVIDKAGMRGARVGGALVSEQHSNFLVNTGTATADDFIELSKNLKKAVFNKTGVTLIEEVRIVGDV